MAKLHIDPLTKALRDFDKQKHPLENYKYLAWTGLHGTTAWNNLSNEERRRIQRTYSNFDNNGSENCN